ncbi:hypothetical protein ABTM83_19240, partial [Acinetobacter baumannii]
MTANTPSPAVEVVPPLPARLTWSVLLVGVGVCVVVGLVGIAIDTAAVASQPAEVAERLKWASGQAGPASEGGSVGDLRKL